MTLAGLAAKNLLRSRFRTVMTVLGVAVTIVTFLLLRAFVDAWYASIDFAVKDRLITRHKITFVMPLPKRYLDLTRATPGIRKSTFLNWFGGKDPQKENEFFTTLAVDTESFFQVYDDWLVTPELLQAWKEDRQGAIVGDVVAAKHGWKIGDRVTLESGIYPTTPDKPWVLNIKGFYTPANRTVDRSTLIFHFDYLNEALPAVRKDQIGWIVSRVDDPQRIAEVAARVDRVFDERDIATLSQDEGTFGRSFMAGFSAILGAVNIVSIAILLIMLLVLGNTIAMGVRERTSEYGVLRAIGFTPRHITTFILMEAGFLGLLGGVVGVALAYPIVEQGIGKYLENNVGAMFPYFRVNPLQALLALGLSLALGLIAGAIPAINAARLRPTEAIRGIV